MIHRGAVDLSLYLVIGPDDTRGRSMVDVALRAVEGGVTAIQLRVKHGPTRAFVEDARRLVAALRPIGIPLIVNDRVDVALAAGADGVHVGQDDLNPSDTRRLIGPALTLGVSVSTLLEAERVDPAIVDYVGVGPVFATPTKPDAADPLGLSGTEGVCAALSVPAVGIGGIDRSNAAAVRAAGAQGVAVVSAICWADDPAHAARELTLAMDPASLAPAR